MRFGKLFTCMAASIAVGAFACAPTMRASAQTDGLGLSDAVVFQACANVASPGVQPALGSGTYTFPAGTCSVPVIGPVANTCTYASVGVDAGDPTGSCTIQASGSYINIVCGTGVTGVSTAPPGALTDTATVNAEGASINLNYSIAFVAGLGVIVGTASGGDESPGVVVGIVQITPTIGNCVTPVTQFLATGVSVLIDANLA
jgi:hypothetical protein